MRVGRDLLAVAIGVCAHKVASRPKPRTLPAVGDLVRVVESRVNEPLEGDDLEVVAPVGTVGSVEDIDYHDDLHIICDDFHFEPWCAAQDAVRVLTTAAERAV